MQECYNEVRSGNEIRSVVMQGARLNEINTGKIDATFTWKASLSGPCTTLVCPGIVVRDVDTGIRVGKRAVCFNCRWLHSHGVNNE